MLNSFYGNVGRLGIYWGIWQIVIYPDCCQVLCERQKSVSSKFIIKSAFVLCIMLYWCYCILLRNFGETIPYESEICSWLNF